MEAIGESLTMIKRDNYSDFLIAIREQMEKRTLTLFTKCLDCNRGLETDEAKITGLGSVCSKHQKKKFTIIPLFKGGLREHALEKISELDVNYVIEHQLVNTTEYSQNFVYQISRRLETPPYGWKVLDDEKDGLEHIRLFFNTENRHIGHNLYSECDGEEWTGYDSVVKDLLLTGESELIHPAKSLAERYDRPVYGYGEYPEHWAEGDINILETSLHDMLHGPGKYSNPDIPQKEQHWQQKAFKTWFNTLSGYVAGDMWEGFGHCYEIGIPEYRIIGTDDYGGYEGDETHPFHYDLLMWIKIAHSNLENERQGTGPPKIWFSSQYWWILEANCDEISPWYPVKGMDGEYVRGTDLWELKIRAHDWSETIDQLVEDAMYELDFDWINQTQQQYLDNLQMTNAPAIA